MSVDEYMKRSLELQEKQVLLLEQISAKLGGTETMTVRVDAKEAAAAVKEVVEGLKADASKGSGKQAKNHDKDDAKQEEQAQAEKPSKKVTADDVRNALMQLGKREGTEAAIALLKKHGVTSVSALQEEQYAQVIEDAKA